MRVIGVRDCAGVPACEASASKERFPNGKLQATRAVKTGEPVRHSYAVFMFLPRGIFAACASILAMSAADNGRFFFSACQCW